MNTPTVELSNTELTRFNELMGETYKKVYNMAYRLSNSRVDAEDLTQEAYYRAYRSFRDYEGDKPFENWIFRIVTRLFLDLLRSRRRRVQAVSYDAAIGGGSGDDAIYFDKADERPNPEQRLLENTFSEDLERVMNSLTAEQRMLIQLADVEGMPYKEIADILGKPVGTIRSRLHRTHKLIRSRLEGLRPSTAARLGAPLMAL